MKNIAQRIMIAVVAVAATQVAMAHSWRINNDASKGAHFASINEAMDTTAVADGDTLYLDPGCVLSDAQTITKAVTVIGTGWGYSHLHYMPARIANVLYVNSAAKVVGVQITNNIYPNHADIVLERCHITGYVQTQKTTGTNNLQVIGCMIDNSLMGYNSSSPGTGWKIFNSVINYSIQNLTDCSIVNCYIRYPRDASYPLLSIKSCLIKNNIILHKGSKDNISDANCSGNNFSNNVLSANDTYAYAEGNYCANSTTVTDFIVNTGAGGAAYQLSENSPAKGFGENGIDCGPYAEGSLYPFVTYGLPEHIPYFTEAVIPTRPTEGKVKVTLKIENQNR